MSKTFEAMIEHVLLIDRYFNENLNFYWVSYQHFANISGNFTTL